MKTTRARMTAHRSAKVEENAISRSSTIRLTLGRSPRSSSAQADAEQQETVARLRLHDIGDVAHVVVERALDGVQRPRAAVPAVVPGVDVAVRKLRGDRRPPGRLNVLAIGVPSGTGS